MREKENKNMTKKIHNECYRQRNGKSIISIGLLHVLLCSCLVTLVFSVTLVFPKSSAVQPELTLYKVASRATATPGDQFNYTIYFENIGPGSQSAQQVWINDTLPSNVTYVNDTAYNLYSSVEGYFQYSILTGNILRIKFTQVPRLNNSFEIRVSVNNTVKYGDILVNRASMNYTNKDNLLQLEVNATASVMVSSPIMQLNKSVEYNSTDPTRANFALRVSNVGSAEALYLWVNDTLPLGINYESYQANPAVSCSEVQPQLVSCVRNNFAPGVEIWRIMITINPSIPPAARLENYAFLNATDQDGSILPEIRANATLVVPTAQINADLVAYQSKAQPGSTIQYSIYFNNTGQFPASHVWINDTLPTGVTFLGATQIPILNITGRVGWYLSDVVVGVHVINFDALLASTLANGTILTNQVSVARWTNNLYNLL